MGWWKRWKEKHWDETVHPQRSDASGWGPEWREAPRFRALVMRLVKQAEENPLGALAVIAGLLGSIAAIIALLL
ncbi:hypothetical protein H0A65_11015 [Alcaligenaceae bacterium]|nr:hypothetical protein [Alcaligenaceae bacterium]